jgi:hypothetical protein
VRWLDISATPTVKLLWGDVDRVAVHLGAVDAGVLGGGGGRLARVPDLEVEVDDLATTVGAVSGVHLRKSGDTLTPTRCSMPEALPTAVPPARSSPR